jgi:hypothetical protein
MRKKLKANTKYSNILQLFSELLDIRLFFNKRIIGFIRIFFWSDIRLFTQTNIRFASLF